MYIRMYMNTCMHAYTYVRRNTVVQEKLTVGNFMVPNFILHMYLCTWLILCIHAYIYVRACMYVQAYACTCIYEYKFIAHTHNVVTFSKLMYPPLIVYSEQQMVYICTRTMYGVNALKIIVMFHILVLLLSFGKLSDGLGNSMICARKEHKGVLYSCYPLHSSLYGLAHRYDA